MQERRQPETLRLKSMMPALTVNDLNASVAWYRDVLGCIVVRAMEDKGQPTAAVLRAGAVEFLLGQDDFAKGRDRAKGVGLRFYCSSRQSVDELAEKLVARGGRLVQQPTDQPWGTRDIAIADPDGFIIAIVNDDTAT